MRVAQRLAGYTLEEADNLRKAAAKKKRDLMRAERSKFVGGCERSGYGPEFGERDVRRHRTVRRLLVPEGARDRLRLHRVPNRVAQGELPGAVPRRAAHERQGQPRQGRGLPQRVPAARDPRARPRRQRVGERLLLRVRRRVQTGRGSLRAVCRAQRRRRCVRADHRGAGSERAVHRLPRLLRPRRSGGAQQAHGRVARPRRRVRLARSHPAGSAASCSSRSSTPRCGAGASANRAR